MAKQRIYYLDIIRIALTVIVIIHHILITYGTADSALCVLDLTNAKAVFQNDHL